MRRAVGGRGSLAAQDGDIEVGIALEGIYNGGTEVARGLEIR